MTGNTIAQDGVREGGGVGEVKLQGSEQPTLGDPLPPAWGFLHVHVR